MPVLVVHPRSEQYHLSLGYLGTSQYIPLCQYFLYIPCPSSTICPWDILGHPRISHYASTSRTSQVRVVPFILETSWDIPGCPPGCPSTLLQPSTVCPWNILGHPRISHYASTSPTSQVRAVPFIQGTSWDIPGFPITPVLLVHPRSEQYHLSLGHLGTSQDFPLCQYIPLLQCYQARE